MLFCLLAEQTHLLKLLLNVLLHIRKQVINEEGNLHLCSWTSLTDNKSLISGLKFLKTSGMWIFLVCVFVVLLPHTLIDVFFNLKLTTLALFLE